MWILLSLAVDSSGNNSKRGRRPKSKADGLDSKAADAELSSPNGASPYSDVSSSKKKPAKIPSSSSDQEVKTLQRSSSSAGDARPDTCHSQGSEDSGAGSTLVQSRLAWKTMAQPAPVSDALKVTVYITNMGAVIKQLRNLFEEYLHDNNL